MTNQRQTRARITQRDAEILGFLGKYPAADAEALSYLSIKEKTPFGNGEGTLTEPSGVEKRLQKLVKLGAATRFRNPINGVNHYGTTALGNEAATIYGYPSTNWRTTEGLSISRLEHYRNIALIAAQFYSPINYFSKSLGIEAVPFESLISENELRKPYDNIRQFLKKKHEQGEGNGDFGTYRTDLMKRILEDANDGKIGYDELTTVYPQLLTLGTASNKASKMKPIHQPDFALRLDDYRRTDRARKGKNWLIEVELSQKSPEDYERILRTFRHEFNSGAAYERAVYFVGTKAIANLIKRVDTAAETNLIQSGQLVILPIEGRDKTQRNTTRRVNVPKGKPATIQHEEDELPDLDQLIN